MDDSSKTLHTDQLTAENLQMADINTQMINIDSVQQTIRQQALESESNGIESSVRELKRLPHETEGVQTCLHETSGARPRSLVQLLHIFDMSNEILREILEDVKGDFETMDDKYPSDGIESIQSLRLTYEDQDIATLRQACERQRQLFIEQSVLL
ncbi:hypothetical protein UCDDA912_g04691 [Diaporthe ampelina]|uniref:Uncharacterized protein n=1 Tax=Diaporthe ampelina TaxID=1214573 RepID=A0A0G2HJZ6_9PEZI|nr:hypothetical protein UCDDA912_g04691 [Diaporthe ampelina]